MFIYCDNTDDRFMVVDGELDVSYDKEAYREFLIYARRLCDEKLLDPLSFTQEYNAAFLSGRFFIKANKPYLYNALSSPPSALAPFTKIT